jgi:hypothetical protein
MASKVSLSLGRPAMMLQAVFHSQMLVLQRYLQCTWHLDKLSKGSMSGTSLAPRQPVHGGVGLLSSQVIYCLLSCTLQIVCCCHCSNSADLSK